MIYHIIKYKYIYMYTRTPVCCTRQREKGKYVCTYLYILYIHKYVGRLHNQARWWPDAGNMAKMMARTISKGPGLGACLLLNFDASHHPACWISSWPASWPSCQYPAIVLADYAIILPSGMIRKITLMRTSYDYRESNGNNVHSIILSDESMRPKLKLIIL